MERRYMTLLNEMGDVTLTWTADQDEKIKTLIEEKLKLGYSFFIIKPSFIPFMTKDVKITSISDIGDRKAIKIKDKEIESLFVQGCFSMAQLKNDQPMETTNRSKDAAEIVKSSTVATRPLRGG